MGPKLLPYKRYKITNAIIKEISDPSFRPAGTTMQWVIGSGTVIEEIDDIAFIVPMKFEFIKFEALPLYLNKSVGRSRIFGTLLSVVVMGPFYCNHDVFIFG